MQTENGELVHTWSPLESLRSFLLLGFSVEGSMSSHCKIGPLSSSVMDISRGLEVEENRKVLESNPPDYLHLDIIDGYVQIEALAS